MQRTWRGAMYWLFLHGLLSLLFYRIHFTRLRVAPHIIAWGFSHKSLIKNIPYRLDCVLISWRHCHTDIKQASTLCKTLHWVLYPNSPTQTHHCHLLPPSYKWTCVHAQMHTQMHASLCALKHQVCFFFPFLSIFHQIIYPTLYAVFSL